MKAIDLSLICLLCQLGRKFVTLPAKFQFNFISNARKKKRHACHLNPKWEFDKNRFAFARTEIELVLAIATKSDLAFANTFVSFPHTHKYLRLLVFTQRSKLFRFTPSRSLGLVRNLHIDANRSRRNR